MFDTDLYDSKDIGICRDLAVDIQAGEVLTEFSTVARDYDLNICVAVNPDSNAHLCGEEYFKVYNNPHPAEATRIARIKFRSPEYVIHQNNGNKENWQLNSTEVKALTELLNKQGKYRNLSVWQSLIYDFNFETDSDCLPKNLTIPDYSLL